MKYRQKPESFYLRSYLLIRAKMDFHIKRMGITRITSCPLHRQRDSQDEADFYETLTRKVEVSLLTVRDIPGHFSKI